MSAQHRMSATEWSLLALLWGGSFFAKIAVGTLLPVGRPADGREDRGRGSRRGSRAAMPDERTEPAHSLQRSHP